MLFRSLYMRTGRAASEELNRDAGRFHGEGGEDIEREEVGGRKRQPFVMGEGHFVMPLAFLSVNSAAAEFSKVLLRVNSRMSANSMDKGALT